MDLKFPSCNTSDKPEFIVKPSVALFKNFIRIIVISKFLEKKFIPPFERSKEE